MTSGGYDPSQDPQNPNPQGQNPQGPPPQGYYPPPQGSYPPPTEYGQQQYGQQPPQYGQPQYNQQQYGQQPPQYGQPQYGEQPGYPTPPQFNQNAGGPGQPADLGTRFLARLIDGLIVGVVAVIIAVVAAGFSSVAVGLLTAILGFAYFVIMETQKGQTVGKMALGLKVRGPGGAPKPTLQQSAIRNAFLLFNIIPVLGFLLVLVAEIVIAVTINSSATKQGKHDELAGGTQVVKG